MTTPFTKLLAHGLLLVSALVLIAGIQVVIEKNVQAAPADNIYGWAWGGDDLNVLPAGAVRGGMGWVSFNCTNTSSCASSPYGVTLSDPDTGGTGLFSGYAWSENFGWFSFTTTELDGCPMEPCEARLLGDTVTGWAKFLNGNNFVHGWDCFVSLNCSSTQTGCLPGKNYGVTFNSATQEFEGWAWGGDVVGWVSFNCTNTSTCGSSLYAVKKGTPPTPQVALSATPSIVASGGTTNLTWADILGNSQFTSCTATDGVSGWPGSKTPPPPNQTQNAVGPLAVVGGVSTPYTFTIICTGPYGSDDASIVVNASPPYFSLTHDQDLLLNFSGAGGDTSTAHIAIQPFFGFSSTISYDPPLVTPRTGSPALPAGVITLSPTSVPSVSGNYASVSLTAASATSLPAGIYDILITAQGGGLTRTDTVTLTITKSTGTFKNF